MGNIYFQALPLFIFNKELLGGTSHAVINFKLKLKTTYDLFKSAIFQFIYFGCNYDWLLNSYWNSYSVI